MKGKRHGKGKEFDEYGKIKFEGKYLNGNRWNDKGFKWKNVAYILENEKGHVRE